MSPPLFLIPGTMCDNRLWAPMLSHMPGSQPHYADYSEARTIEGMMDAILEQVPDEPSHLVGFSLGGYLAIMAATHAPEHFKSLTVIAASPYGLTESEKKLRHRNVEVLSRLTYKGMSKTRLAQFVSNEHLKDETITNTILAMERDLGQQVLIRQLIAPIDRPDITESLSSLEIPVQFIMEKEDQLVPIEAIEKLATKSDSITLHTIENTGHMIPLEAPKQLADLIQNFIR